MTANHSVCAINLINNTKTATGNAIIKKIKRMCVSMTRHSLKRRDKKGTEPLHKSS